MLRATIDTLVPVVAGELLEGFADGVVNGLVIDSRAATPGSLFVAMPGERVDGHEFVGDALLRGARGVVISRAPGEIDPDLLERARHRGAAIVRVANSLGAIQALASWHRSRLSCPVVGITGSTGKTTTKDLLTSALATRFAVVATTDNRNNELGVPLTILEADLDTEVVVVEMGMRGLGQIRALCEIALPTAGLVTNVGMSHIELLSSEEAVADAKAELVEAIPAEGVVFLNGDDAYTERIAALSAAPVIRYGLSDGCSVKAEGISLDAESRASFTLVTPEASAEVSLPVPGRHNVYNALAASAVAVALGCTLTEVAAGLGDATLSGMRMEVFDTAWGVTVVNDAYNANPASMRAALDTLSEMRVEGRRVAVLGDMAELGSLTELAHFQLGELVARLPIDALVTVGSRAARIADGARAAGMDPDSVRRCSALEEASEVLDDLLEPGDTVLVKASRVMGLERVVEGIVTPRV